MLGKLLKYDNREMARTFVPFFIVTIVIALVNCVFIRAEWVYAIMGGSMILIMVCMALAVTALILVINQFYQNVLGDQGYLTNTLPVSVDSIILSKLICAMIWFALSVIVAAVTGGIILLSFVSISDFSSLWAVVAQAISETWAELVSIFGTANSVVAAVFVVLNIIAAIIQELLHIYFSMACSQLGFLAKNRIASSFLVYVISNIILSFVTFGVMAAAAFVHTKLTAVIPANTMSVISLAGSFLFMMILNAVFYFSTRYILKNKLNLE